MNDTVVIDSINYSTEAIPYVTLDHKTNLVLIFRNWDLYFICKLNKYLVHLQPKIYQNLIID